jgi:uncharacterized membrane protein (UPF0127 family)
VKAIDLTQNSVVAESVEIADTPRTRMKGLLGRTSLAQDQALLITHCNSIHMFFMRFPIDAVFLDRADRVVGIVKTIQPFALSPIFWTADKVLELPSGAIESRHIVMGDQLQFERV